MWNRLRLAVWLGLVVCALVIPLAAHAVVVETLYDAEVLVKTGEPGERRAAFRAALSQVLVRVTGRRDAASRPEAGDLLKQADSYVQQYRYLDVGAEETLRLWVRFDGAALDEAVSAAGLPVWGNERPALLVWMAVDRNGRRQLVGDSDEVAARDVLRESGDARGIPVVFPVLDLQDRNQVSAADVLGGFDDAVRQASERYGPDAVLMVRAKSLSGGYWRVDWRMYLGRQTLDWRSEGARLESALQKGFNDVADSLGGRMAVRDSTRMPARVVLEVGGVRNLQEFVRVQRYLEGVGQVRVVRPLHIGGTQVSFLAQVKGEPEDLRQMIQLGSVLEPAMAENPMAMAGEHVAAGGDATVPVLRYQLLPP